MLTINMISNAKIGVLRILTFIFYLIYIIQR